MPNIAPITIANNTLVTTYTPVKTRADNTVAEFRSGVGQLAYALRLTSRAQGNNAHRAIVKLEVPVIQSIEGIDTVIDNEIIEINYRRSEHQTMATRLLVSDLVSKVLSAQLVTDVTEKSEGFW